MAVTINGTTGIAGVDGSAGTPAVQGADSNTGIFFPAADTIAFAEGGAEVARFDSSGNFGLGVTPSAWSGGYVGFQVKDAAFASFSSGYTWVGNNWYNNSGNKYIANGTATLYEQNGGAHKWFYAASGTAGNTISFTQAMTLDSSGNLLVGRTALAGTNDTTLGFQCGGGNFAQQIPNNAVSGWNVAAWYRGSSSIGNIQYNGSGVTYNTSSDRRLKTNIDDAKSGLSRVLAVSVKSFDWIESGIHTPHGFVAQELVDIFPDAVAVGDTGDEIKDVWGVDFSRLVPAMVKAIQEQQALIESLTARIAALEAA